MFQTRKLCALAVLAALSAGCSTTVLEQRTRMITIRTTPPGATLTKVDIDGANVIGKAPTTIKHQSQVRVRRFRTWLWAWPALTGLCSVAGFAGAANASDAGVPVGIVFGTLCALATVPTLIVNLVHQVRSGTVISQQAEVVRFDASLPGYHPVSRSVRAGETAVNLKLIPSDQPPAPDKPPAPAAASSPIVAVFAVEDASKSHDATTLSQLTDFLASKLTEVAGYRIIPRDRLRSELRQQKKEGYKRCYEQACQIELGRAVSAQKSLATKLLKVGKTCAITATLFDLKTETTETAASTETSCGVNDLMKGLSVIAEKLARAQGTR